MVHGSLKACILMILRLVNLGLFLEWKKSSMGILYKQHALSYVATLFIK